MPTEIDWVAERFEKHVTTRQVDLLCDTCGGRWEHQPHVYDHLDFQRDADGALQGAKVIFRCLTCNTTRQWGAIGPKPEIADTDE